MARLLFGIETEYAVAAFDAAGRPAERESVVRALLCEVASRLPHLHDLHSSGFFLGNGSRMYVDSGLHPEVATPECTDPWEAVRYGLAGDEILAGAARRVEAGQETAKKVWVAKSNVDYLRGATWASHESYMHEGPPEVVHEFLIPHLVSRVIYAGAGGFEVAGGSAVFLVSPRAAFIEHVATPTSTHDRGIIHLKDEPLAPRGCHRVHVITGESLSSHAASWLRIASTALVVAMARHGVLPLDDVRLESPVAALKAFAADTSLSASVRTSRGAILRAAEIQRKYLSAAERCLGAPFFPAWAGDACRRWRGALDLLDDRPGDAWRSLDWASKLRVFRRHLESRGVSLESAPRAGLPATIPRHFLLELFELDARYSQLGPGSLFSALDSGGWLDHRVPGVDRIDAALVEPPASGRGKTRGACVQRLAGEGARYVCDWRGIVDARDQRFLDFGDPLNPEETWRPPSKRLSVPWGSRDEAPPPWSLLDVLRRR